MAEQDGDYLRQMCGLDALPVDLSYNATDEEKFNLPWFSKIAESRSNRSGFVDIRWGWIMNPQFFEQARGYALHRLERELSPNLFYHGITHTRDDVVPAAELLAKMEKINGESYYLLLTAAWFHDLGFIEVRAGHEAIGARLASEVLPGFGYTEEQIQIVRGIIIATVVPQSPQTQLEQIMADADLEVLGRDDFMTCNDNLRRELAFSGQKYTDPKWYTGQLKFIEDHTYFTESAHKLWNPGQVKNITELKKKLEGY